MHPLRKIKGIGFIHFRFISFFEFFFAVVLVAVIIIEQCLLLRSLTIFPIEFLRAVPDSFLQCSGVESAVMVALKY